MCKQLDFLEFQCQNRRMKRHDYHQRNKLRLHIICKDDVTQFLNFKTIYNVTDSNEKLLEVKEENEENTERLY